MTAETAVVLPVLVLVLALCATALSAGVMRIRCLDGARAAARELARGEDPDSARRAALQVAPGAVVSLTVEGALVRVVVRDRMRAAVPGLDAGVDIPVAGEAVAARESG